MIEKTDGITIKPIYMRNNMDNEEMDEPLFGAIHFLLYVAKWLAVVAVIIVIWLLVTIFTS